MTLVNFRAPRLETQDHQQNKGGKKWNVSKSFFSFSWMIEKSMANLTDGKVITGDKVTMLENVFCLDTNCGARLFVPRKYVSIFMLVQF